MFGDVLKNSFVAKVLEECKPPRPFGDWRDRGCQWFNWCVGKPWFPKRPVLLIYGDPNSGKTFFVQQCLLSCLSPQQIFTPTRAANGSDGRFAWQDFDEKLHKVVYIEEFNAVKHEPDRLKIAFEGGVVKTDEKYRRPRCFEIRCPVILCSQRNLAGQINGARLSKGYIDPEEFTGMKERMVQIHAKDTNFDLDLINWFREKRGLPAFTKEDNERMRAMRKYPKPSYLQSLVVNSNLLSSCPYR